MSIETITFGCRLNAYESEVMKAEAQKSGLDNAIIINTCAVTAEAVRQAKQTIRKARRENADARIIVTGCAAQTQARDFGDMAEVDLVIGNNDKLKAESYRPIAFGVALNDKVQVNDIMSVTETAGHLIDGLDGRARAFVQVQNGCDHRCTFCIIPFGRGPSRSVPMGVVVDQIRRLVDNGYAEVVLTGVDITSYGSDLPGSPTLGRLTQSILKHVPSLQRLRISSIDSIEADPALYEAVTDPRLMPHLHLSLQSGDDMILKRMKRRHSRADALGIVEKLRGLRPDMVFGADIIAGFPTETDIMFENTLRFVTEADLTYLHVFPFSPREGTPAAKMPQVSRRIGKERAARLRALGETQFARLCASRVGKTESILVERDGMGRTEQFIPVAVERGRPGDIVTAEIDGTSTDGLIARRDKVAA
ncbi:tRNA (N(6)-L-threonylcarbamoyladenosine(37)-C(2))-methylthiotransferase MtaB [Pelagibacterium halotolerans]|uniref:tRNA (N(6)-L-threonylcarbamoyladenosine(37)-C(2))-methylthiotransferase n=1 Tax=Pelagibacterium halotolerans (strain DSM 22347 / JCM 15775 / CGMCC 1.7692 / B2) TaxID=1082931 RepID=G4R701_PELHB|nr:tRNA (N(6)-L-threonylcarbamoyladenosine(37)-C(2))-methylthiotransferase MtaB [Pelagibacterium halotolerans]AEQ53274.1 MiaB family protein, possibly involved in tRNA or rRNA modification [Pelagibacterium halotolerans B2]QJR17106.1 tRNA (N(6)-L-threonylcarbamoyladenosine(37)-C(2))-methylthiotransferase MtaB [Pelagibacterium halotolerans]SEA96975.1 threonylcarbamoyladenosine tRNA methylthiotransferase MtaB [Pelagibacterium halotolerans]